MKKLMLITALMLAVACVGQRDDPEIPDDTPENPDIPAPADSTETVSGTCLILDFTGTWCVNCPRMEAAIEEAMASRPGAIVPVSVHCLTLDPMAPMPLSSDLASRFGVSAYPSVVVDLVPGSLFSTTSPELLLSRCDAALAARGEAAELTAERSGSMVTVSATIAQPGDYTLDILVLEDGIVAAQTGGSEQHVHNNVLRQWIVSEPFTSLGKGDEILINRALLLTEGQRIVALACRDGIVNAVLPLQAE